MDNELNIYLLHHCVEHRAYTSSRLLCASTSKERIVELTKERIRSDDAEYDGDLEELLFEDIEQQHVKYLQLTICEDGVEQ